MQVGGGGWEVVVVVEPELRKLVEVNYQVQPSSPTDVQSGRVTMSHLGQQEMEPPWRIKDGRRNGEGGGGVTMGMQSSAE